MSALTVTDMTRHMQPVKYGWVCSEDQDLLWICSFCMWHNITKTPNVLVSHTDYSQLQQRVVTPPNAAPSTTPPPSADPTAATPQLWKVLHVQVRLRCCRWLTAALMFDEGLGMNQRLVSQSVWCGEHPNLCYCYPSPSGPAIHWAEDRVLHSHSESFTRDRNTMMSV